MGICSALVSIINARRWVGGGRQVTHIQIADGEVPIIFPYAFKSHNVLHCIYTSLFVSGRLLPSAVFLAWAAAAIYFLFVRCLIQGRIRNKLDVICDVPLEVTSNPLRMAYTGNLELDKALCGIGVFYHTAMTPSYLPFFLEFMGAVTAIFVIPFAEASRDSHASSLGTGVPGAIGTLAQFFSMGLVMPLYYLAFIRTGAADRKPGPVGGSKINQGNAEALLFGLIIGCIIPTACLVLLQDPVVTAIWQIFPVIMEIAQLAHRIIRPPSRLTASGYYTVQATYAMVLVGSAAIHIHYIWPLFDDIDALKQLFLPPFGPSDPAASPLLDGILYFYKWDNALCVIPTFFLVLWFTDDLLSCVVVVAWCVATTIVLGPGAAITSILIWREEKLNRPNNAVKVVEKQD